jgi:predicted benzoate:H+ symporter BenE
MFSAIQPWHRPTTPMTRMSAAMADLPLPHRKRHRRMGPAAMVSGFAGLVVALMGAAAVIFRDKLSSMMGK